MAARRALRRLVASFFLRSTLGLSVRLAAPGLGDNALLLHLLVEAAQGRIKALVGADRDMNQ